MVVFIIWNLEWMKILFKLTFNREIVIPLREYKCFDYCFQVLFVNVTVWYYCALNISVNIVHSEILRQSRLKWETQINWRGHEIFSLMVLWTTKFFLKNFIKSSSPLLSYPFYILNVHSFIARNEEF